jgi:hypothetical protein
MKDHYQNGGTYPYRRKPVSRHLHSWMPDQVRHGEKGPIFVLDGDTGKWHERLLREAEKLAKTGMEEPPL